MHLELSKKRVQQMAQTLRAETDASARPSHTQALDTVARMLGHQDFNALKPALSAPAQATPANPGATTREPMRVLIDLTTGAVREIKAEGPVEVMVYDYEDLRNGDFSPPDSMPIAEQVARRTPQWERATPCDSDALRREAGGIQDHFHDRYVEIARALFGDEVPSDL